MRHPPYPYYFRERARVLKAHGESVRAIAEQMGVGKSAVGLWVRGMHEEPAMLKYCVKCGDAFLAGRRDATKCPGGCDKLRREPRAPRVPRIRQCKLCGVDFQRRGPAKYCCIEHRYEYRHQKYVEGKRSHARKCKTCQCDFLAPHGNLVHCPAHRKNRSRAKTYPLRWCPYCGVKFAPYHGNQKFCCKGHQRLYRMDSGDDYSRELVAA